MSQMIKGFNCTTLQPDSVGHAPITYAYDLETDLKAAEKECKRLRASGLEPIVYIRNTRGTEAQRVETGDGEATWRPSIYAEIWRKR
jgi:hypothetical protein